MKNTLLKGLMILGIVTLTACSAGGSEGEECSADADCAEGLECHFHEHDGEVEDHGECEAHEE